MDEPSFRLAFIMVKESFDIPAILLHTYLMLGGPQKLNFFQSRVTKKSKLQSSTSLAAFTPGKVSRFYLLPPHNGAPPSPPVSPRLHARSLAMHGNQLTA